MSISDRGGLSLIVDPIHGGPLTAPQKIEDPPTDVLVGGCECAMVVMVDRTKRRALFQVPNNLGWRYHFGCTIAPKEAEKDQPDPWDHARSEGEKALKENGVECGRIKPAGMMFFTFGRHADPMRIRVFECDPPIMAKDSAVGQFYNFDVVPYDQMWADDIIWLPPLLREAKYFEAHFVFDGPPSGESTLLQHNYHVYE